MAEDNKVVDKTNWADMDNDEEDDQEDIGVASKQPKDTPATAEEEKKEGAEGAVAEGTEAKPKRVKKDYGAAYNPNYKRDKWRKGQFGNDEQKKNMAPAVPRQKNERGDYVVTSFTVLDRKEQAAKVEKVSDTAQINKIEGGWY
jgi:hypothetical protein